MPTSEDNKERRRQHRYRNRIAKQLRENSHYHIRKVEDKTKLYHRQKMKDLLREVREDD